MNGKVGIITRTKNRPVLLKRAIESVIDQSYENWVMIIVNDGGDQIAVDNLVRHYEQGAKNRINVIHNEYSLGMEAASNIGIKAANAEYIAIHDDDDSWSPEFLAIAVAELKQAHASYPRIMGVITMAYIVYERIESQQAVIERVEEYNPEINTGLISLEASLIDPQFAPIQFLYRSETLADTGLYREDLPVLGDWEFNIRFLSKYDIFVIPQKLAFYHHRQHDLHSTYGNSIFARRERHEFFRQLLKNEWLRKDLESGATSISSMASRRPSPRPIASLQQDWAENGMEAVLAHLDKLSNRIAALEWRRRPIRNFLQLQRLWLKSGRPLHYLFRFIESVRRQGVAETMKTVKLWLDIQRSRPT
ncbi:MAG: glycosyltransferase [Methylococcus sp.]|nr:glycosyltransferase [Methylococcus sp.]